MICLDFSLLMFFNHGDLHNMKSYPKTITSFNGDGKYVLNSSYFYFIYIHNLINSVGGY